MINKLVVGISQQLNALFGDSYDIYTEDISQGLNTPAFYIRLLQSESAQVVGTRYFRTHSFDIHFFPEGDGTEIEQCQEVMAKLLAEMEYITIETGVIRGTQISTEIIDGVLHFFVQYNFHVLKVVEPEEMMGDLTVNQGIRSDEQ